MTTETKPVYSGPAFTEAELRAAYPGVHRWVEHGPHNWTGYLSDGRAGTWMNVLGLRIPETGSELVYVTLHTDGADLAASGDAFRLMAGVSPPGWTS